MALRKYEIDALVNTIYEEYLKQKPVVRTRKQIKSEVVQIMEQIKEDFMAGVPAAVKPFVSFSTIVPTYSSWQTHLIYKQGDYMHLDIVHPELRALCEEHNSLPKDPIDTDVKHKIEREIILSDLSSTNGIDVYELTKTIIAKLLPS
jgi:hypothetical protein